MSYTLSAISPPVDSSLPRHGMFRQTDDAKWKVNLYMLFKNLPDTKGRRSHWYTTSQSMVQKLPDEYRKAIREICSIDASEIGPYTWISIEAALVLLTYGSRMTKHSAVLEWVERYTGVKLPKDVGRSRREAVFAHLLRIFLEKELSETTNGEYKLEYQYRLCGGKYFADFSVKHYWDGEANSEKFDWYIIEFDEEEHELPASKLRDQKRDMEIRDTYPLATLIRVKHDEVENWFKLVSLSHRLIGFESACLAGIVTACSTIKDQEVCIDSTTAKSAFDFHENEFADVLLFPNQPLRGLKLALERCAIDCRCARTNKSRQLRVSLASLIAVMHRWWPTEAVDSAMRNICSTETYCDVSHI